MPSHYGKAMESYKGKKGKKATLAGSRTARASARPGKIQSRRPGAVQKATMAMMSYRDKKGKR